MALSDWHWDVVRSQCWEIRENKIKLCLEQALDPNRTDQLIVVVVVRETFDWLDTSGVGASGHRVGCKSACPLVCAFDVCLVRQQLGCLPFFLVGVSTSRSLLLNNNCVHFTWINQAKSIGSKFRIQFNHKTRLSSESKGVKSWIGQTENITVAPNSLFACLVASTRISVGCVDSCEWSYKNLSLLWSVKRAQVEFKRLVWTQQETKEKIENSSQVTVLVVLSALKVAEARLAASRDTPSELLTCKTSGIGGGSSTKDSSHQSWWWWRNEWRILCYLSYATNDHPLFYAGISSSCSS